MIDIISSKMEEHRQEGKIGGNGSVEGKKAGNAKEKYGLRPRTIIKRLQQEKSRQEVPKPRPARSKSRPAPLSKYRRKTANARERHRMKEINNAFESLRKVLPALEIHTSSSSMTKITTLRMAVGYIRALSEVLEDDGEANLLSLQTTIHQSIHDSLQHSMQVATPSAGDISVLQHGTSMSYFAQQCMPHVMDYRPSCGLMSSSSGSSLDLRGSVSSGSDLEELLSDDSVLLEDNLDVFHDIQTFCEGDPLEVILAPDKIHPQTFTHEMCN
ncbi:achaete-scute complex protein T5-like [Penaeus monodon]|uniref:achaete-scute complex protein T5-like n=1 Tax=Penaeus monodon TaxID=6687 RepID=UPI0018A7C38A|nr:achaete-scute complex protein T5-like [Penaeus monodon]